MQKRSSASCKSTTTQTGTELLTPCDARPGKIETHIRQRARHDRDDWVYCTV